jgi:hypothetical protein
MEVGKLYMVKCVQWRFLFKDIWVPIYGELHSDPEIGNPKLHYHVDYRFMTDNYIKLLYNTENIENLNSKIKIVGISKDKKYKFLTRRLRCYRNFWLARPQGNLGDNDCGTISDITYKEFEGMFCDEKIIVKDSCRFCPHKGTPLDDATQIKKGVIECPAHGLAWDLTTNRLHVRTADC